MNIMCEGACRLSTWKMCQSKYHENYRETLLTPLICSICSCQDPAQMPDVFKQLSLSRAAQGSLVFVEIFNLCLF